MKFTVKENLVLLEALVDELSGTTSLDEESKLTPYQKAQQNRRKTLAAHTPRPAKQSVFYKHAVRAIFQKLRKNGEGFKGAAKGGQLIAQWMLKKYGYAQGKYGETGVDTGDFSLTSKGRKRNIVHSKEASSIRKKKERAYDYIMGIQRRDQARQQQIKHRSMGAG